MPELRERTPLLWATTAGYQNPCRTFVEVSYALLCTVMQFATENAGASDFAGILGDANAIWTKSVTTKVDKVVVRVAPSGELDGERVRAVPDQNIYDGHSGDFLYTLAPLVVELVNYPGMRDRLLTLGAEAHR